MNSFGARLSSFGGSRNIPPAVRAAAVASGASPYEIVSLDFANQQYWRQGVRSSFAAIPGLVTSGGVNGTRETSAGIVSASAPRINTAGSRGLSVEGEGTNLLPHSQDYDNVGWRLFDVSGSASRSANVLNFGASGVDRFISPNATVSAVEYVGHIVLSGSGDVRLYLIGGDGSTGTPSLITLTDTPTLYQVNRVVAAGSSGSLGIYNGAGASPATVTIHRGAQLEPGSTPSTYIPTAGAAVTRTADSITLDMSDLGLASDQLWQITYADGSTGTLNAVADTLTFPASTKVYASAYAVAL